MANIPKVELPQFPVVAFNAVGLDPIEAVFRITKADLERYIVEMARKYCKGFEKCNIEADSRSRTLGCYVWIPSNDPDITDDSLRQKTNVIFTASLTRLSENMKQFMNAYCNKDRKKLLREESGNKFVAIEVDLTTVVNALFDTQGKTYVKVLTAGSDANSGFTAAQPCNIDIVPVPGDNGDVKAFVIHKRRFAKRDLSDLRPRRAHWVDRNN